MEPWWKKPETSRGLQAFHERSARQPNIDLHKRIHTTITNAIRDRLIRDRKCKRVEYTGSAYEGVQIGPEVEFDVMFVMDGAQLQAQNTTSGEHFYLKAQQDFSWGTDKKYDKFIDSSTKKLIPDKFKDGFFSTLDIVVRELNLGHKIVLRKNGPAIQLDVYEHQQDRTPLYNVDMVPCFELSGGRQFVAKPIKTDITSADRHLFWRESFSKDENEFFRSADEGNGCRKKAIRILKAIKQKETALQGLSSYHFKTTLMVLCERNNSKDHWKETNLVLRLMDMLAYLEECARRRSMDHFYFGNKSNQMANLSPTAAENIYCRIDRIRKNEHIFLAIIN